MTCTGEKLQNVMLYDTKLSRPRLLEMVKKVSAVIIALRAQILAWNKMCSRIEISSAIPAKKTKRKFPGKDITQIC